MIVGPDCVTRRCGKGIRQDSVAVASPVYRSAVPDHGQVQPIILVP